VTGVPEELQRRGTQVCVKGVGQDAGIHTHTMIKRVTQTLIITNTGVWFRRNTGQSTPFKMEGGTYIAASCQLKEGS
jgi:hypothetical protein